MAGAGDKDHPITIESLVLTVNAVGERIESWVKFADVWAKVTQVSGKEYLAGERKVGELTTKFYIYPLPGLLMTMRVLHDGLTYDIEQIIPYGRQKGVEIVATAKRS